MKKKLIKNKEGDQELNCTASVKKKKNVSMNVLNLTIRLKLGYLACMPLLLWVLWLIMCCGLFINNETKENRSKNRDGVDSGGASPHCKYLAVYHLH